MTMKNKPKVYKKSTVSIAKTTKFGKNVEIFPNVHIIGICDIGDNVKIGPNSTIINSRIKANTQITNSYIEESNVGSFNIIGPFARLRPNTKTYDNVKIGNFVEIKNSNIGNGCKISHLAYVGDADIGENVNIGCGVIFVNYNGREKNRTFVGDNVFVGSNANIIAPVTIESNSYICAGTTVTNHIAEGDFVIGRVRQENKKNRASKYLKEN